ncbi:MAG: phosphatase PAP2 family protein [Planctomycetes bacterium]|nr:phosphatase PAP2 family protein [Planctomycetota bacterium]
MAHGCRWLIKSLVVVIIAVTITMGSGCAVSSQDAFTTIKDDLLKLPGDMWTDTKEMVAQPENVAILVIGGAASGYTRWQHDDQIEDHFENHRTFHKDFDITVGTLGNPATHFAFAGAGYLYGLMNEQPQTKDVSSSLIEALALNGLITQGLKFVAWDQTPNEEYFGWPSGHTSSTVTVATVMNEHYGPWVGVPLFALSGLVMYERLDNGEHWASDVVFGAALGYVVGSTVAKRYKPEIFGMEVMPYIDPLSGSTGLALMKRF